MSDTKLSYDYLNQDEEAQSIIRKFNKGIYGKDIENAEENTAKFLEHHRKYDMLNEFTVLGDLSYVRDEEERNGISQEERLLNYRQARDLFENYEGGLSKGGESGYETIKDYMEGFAMSPSLWLGIFTGGAGKTAQVAATRLSSQAVKEFVKNRTKTLAASGRKPTVQNIRKFGQTKAVDAATKLGGLGSPVRAMTARQAAGKYGLKQAGIAAGIEGTAGALTNVAQQAVEMEGENLGLQTREAFSPGEAAAMGALSTVTAGGITYPLAKWQATRAARVAGVVGGETAITNIAIRNAKEKIDGDEVARARLEEIKEKLSQESEDLWNNIDDKGKELLEENFGGTDLTKSQIKTGINDNVAYAFTELFHTGKIRFLDTEEQSITRQVFNALDPKGDNPVAIPEIKETLQKYGLGMEDFRFMWWSTISDAGRTLGIWGRLTKDTQANIGKFQADIRKGERSYANALGYTGSLREAEQASIALEKAAASGSATHYIRTVDNFRRAMMVMQPKTAVRNFISVVGRLPLDAGARLVDNSIAMMGNYVTGQPISTGVRWTDSFSIFKNVLDNAKAGAQIEELLTNVDRYHYHNLFTNYSEISHAMGKNTSSTTRGFQKVADTLNIMNRTQEHLFRRAVFMGSIERQLSRRGIVGKDGLYKNMTEFVEGSKDGTKASGLTNKALWTDKDNMIERAIEDALDFTFQGNVGARGTRTYAEGPIVQSFDYIAKPLVKLLSTPVAGTAFIPFPRFLYNALKFQIEYSPLGMYDAFHTKVFREQFKTITDKEGKKLPADYSRLGRSIAGTTAFLGAYMFRKSKYAGEKFDEAKDERGNSVNIGAIGPNVVPNLFWADWYIKNIEEAKKPISWSEIERQMAEGTPIEKIEKTVKASTGPRGYRNAKEFWRDATRAGIGTQARVGQFSTFIDDLFVNTNSSRIDKDYDSGSVFVNLRKAFEPLEGLVGNYFSGVVTPFAVMQDMYSVYDGEDEISRSTQFNKLSGPSTARIPKPLRVLLSGLGAYEETLPVKDAFGPGFIRKQAPVLQQMTGLLIKRPKTPEQKEFDRLGFQYQDLIRWDESPSLTYAYKLSVDQSLKAIRPYIESDAYQNKTDAERATWWADYGILMIRTNSRDRVKTLFADKFSDDNFYDSLNILRGFSHEKLVELESKGLIDQLIEERNLDKDSIEENMKRRLYELYKDDLR